MPRSYASLLRLQGGWSSLQRHSHTPNNTYRKPTRQTSRLGIPGLKPSRKCAQIIFRSRQTAEVGVTTEMKMSYSCLNWAAKRLSTELPGPHFLNKREPFVMP